jgi:hypothetical protein
MGRLTYGLLVASLTIAVSIGCNKSVYRPPWTPPPPTPPRAVGLGKLYTGPSHPPPETGTVGDFFLDIGDSLIYGPKTDIGWGSGLRLAYRVEASQFLSGVNIPSSSLGVIGDYYLDLSNGSLFGPKDDNGWPGGGVLQGDTTAASGLVTQALIRGDLVRRRSVM